MKRLLHITLPLLLAFIIASAHPVTVRADGGDDEHTAAMETEVNGIHVSLASQHEWKKGENTIIVTLMDSTGQPVSNADVEILIGSAPDEHTEPEQEDKHDAPEAASAHGAGEGHSMPGMEVHEPAGEAHNMQGHIEEPNSLSLHELEENGIYVVEAQLDSSGSHQVHVMFRVNDEMRQADFVVEIPGVLSRAVVLWSFVAINIVLIASAGMMKRQSVPVKGR